MILTCPACAANFALDPKLLGDAGRVVRCGKCKHEWHATAPIVTLAGAAEEESAALFNPPPLIPIPASASLLADYGKAKPRHAGRNAVLLALLLAVLVAAPLLGWRLRDQLGQGFGKVLHDATATLAARSKPETALPENTVNTAENTADAPAAPAVVIDGIPTTQQKEEDGHTLLVIRGAVLNKTQQDQPLPPLQAQAMDAQGQVVKTWIIPLNATTLEAQHRLPFDFTTPLDTPGVVDIAFHFLPPAL